MLCYPLNQIWPNAVASELLLVMDMTAVGGDISEPVSQRKPWILIEDALTKQTVEEK